MALKHDKRSAVDAVSARAASIIKRARGINRNEASAGQVASNANGDASTEEPAAGSGA